jgi:adenine/guanine phosphoribosyltransferase-like PRPP-binding protein
MGAAMLPLLLARDRDTSQQARLDRRARMDNIAGAFRVRDPERVRGRAVLLVDDVCTTGATLGACSRVLIEAHATSVARAVVARAQSDRTACDQVRTPEAGGRGIGRHATNSAGGRSERTAGSRPWAEGAGPSSTR